MQRATALLILLFTSIFLPAQEKSDGPTNEKAQKTYKQAQEYLRQRMKDPLSTPSRKPTSRTTATALPANAT